jgi:glutamate-1-semialdehyde 2,1-aminomutase
LVRTAEEELVSLVADDPLNVFSRIEKAIERFDLDLVVRITGDNPLTDPFHLDKMIEEHIAFGADYTFNKDMPIGTKGEVFKASAIQKAHRYASDPNLSEYMTFFFKDSDFFSSHEYKSGFENVSDIRLTVDFQEDFLIVKNIAENIYPGNPGFTVSDILAYLEKNPSLLEMNKNMVSPFNNPIMEKCFIQQKPRA